MKKGDESSRILFLDRLMSEMSVFFDELMSKMTEEEKESMLNLDPDKSNLEVLWGLLQEYSIKYKTEIPALFRERHKAGYTKKDDAQIIIPGLEKFLHDPDEEKEKEEEQLYFEDLIRVFLYGENKREVFNELNPKQKYGLALKYAEMHDRQLPLSIKRRLRTWSGPDSYKELKKATGYKLPVEVEKRIHAQFPLSTKGFKKHVGPEYTSLTRKIGNKEVKIIIASGLMVPAGDLAKRLFRGIAMFSSQRKTLDPGPIEYKELLDRIGELPCSEAYMRRIRDLCLAIRHSSITVTTRDKNGKVVNSDYAPFFKRFIWEGGVDLNARIFPIFNEELFNLLVDEDLGHYVWIEDKRLKRLPGMTARDRLAQDQFKMLLGIPGQQTKMRNWIQKFGQLTDTELLKMPLSTIRAFVNKNFEQAERDSLILEYEIRSFHKKEKYLNQMIWLKPAKPPPPKKKVELTSAELKELRGDMAWLDEVTVEDYGRTEYEDIEDYLTNAAEAGNLDCIREARRLTEDSWDPDYPVEEDGVGYKNRPMHFWDFYRHCKEEKKVGAS
jgi:hypothetical protein